MADEERQSATLSGHQEALDFAHRCHQEAIKRSSGTYMSYSTTSVRCERSLKAGTCGERGAVVSTCMLGWYRRMRFKRGAQCELNASSRRARTHLARELHIGTDVEEGGRVRSTARAQLKLIGELLRYDEGGN